MEHNRAPYSDTKTLAAVEAANAANNVIEVGSQTTYTTVDLAIAAAVAAGATAASPWAIYALPGTSRAYTPNTACVVTFEEDLAQITDTRLDLPTVVRAPAAVAWVVDDGDNSGNTAGGTAGWWFTANAGLADALNGNANATPLEYLRRRQIVITFGITTNWINTANYFSSAQLRTIEMAGHEIASHTATHSPSPATLAAEISEIRGSKRTLTAILNTGAVIDGLNTGSEVETFINSGDWADPLRHRDPTDMDTSHGRLVKREYKYSRSDLLWKAIPLGCLGRYATLPNGQFDFSATTTTVDQYIAAACTVGAVTTFYHHKVVASGAAGVEINVALFKYIADSLYTQILAGKVRPVTFATACNCVLKPPAATEWVGGVPFGLVSAGVNTADPLMIDWTTPLGTGYALTVEEDATDPNTLHNYAQDKYIQLVEGDPQVFTVVKWSLGVRPGKRYAIAFDVKQYDTGKGESIAVQLEFRRHYGATPAVAGLTIDYVVPVTAAWITHGITFKAPAWARDVTFRLRCSGYHAGYGWKASNVTRWEI